MIRRRPHRETPPTVTFTCEIFGNEQGPQVISGFRNILPTEIVISENPIPGSPLGFHDPLKQFVAIGFESRLLLGSVSPRVDEHAGNCRFILYWQ